MVEPTGSSSETTTTTATICAPCQDLDASSRLSRTQVEEGLKNKDEDDDGILGLWTIGDISSPPVVSSPNVKNNGDTNTGNNELLALTCSFVARNFQAAMTAMHEIGVLAERMGHHPDLHLTNYRHVQIVVYTHKVQGITNADLDLVTAIHHQVRFEYSPKWLKEHPEATATAKAPAGKDSS